MIFHCLSNVNIWSPKNQSTLCGSTSTVNCNNSVMNELEGQPNNTMEIRRNPNDGVSFNKCYVVTETSFRC
jgi:hypothetical protein